MSATAQRRVEGLNDLHSDPVQRLRQRREENRKFGGEVVNGAGVDGSYEFDRTYEELVETLIAARGTRDPLLEFLCREIMKLRKQVRSQNGTISYIIRQMHMNTGDISTLMEIALFEPEEIGPIENREEV